MLVNFDEVAAGALVNAIAVVGRQVSKAAAGCARRMRAWRPPAGLRRSA